MSEYAVHFGTIAFAGGLFLAIILSLAIPPKHTKRVLSTIAAVTVVAALILYGMGYSASFLEAKSNPEMENPTVFTYFTYILLTVWDSCRIFGGSNNWGAVKNVLGENTLGQLVFWTVHILAMTTSASAIIVSLGSKLLKKIRIRIFRMRDISLIYGLSENTLDFGRQLTEKEKCAVLFVDSSPKTDLQKAAEQMGALVRSDSDALEGNSKFLKSIGLKPGKRELHVYALDSSMVANQQYAHRLRASLVERKILAKQTRLTILQPAGETKNPLQAVGKDDGFDSVLSVDEPELVARVLIRSYPPYKVLEFDKEGKPTKNFHGVVIGFGRIGQAVLKQMVIHSQFQGGKSRIAMFAPDYLKRAGLLSYSCREMLKHYNIERYACDGRSGKIYAYLNKNIDSVNYIAVCAGSEIMNMEIAEQLQTFLHQRKRIVPIMMCSNKGVIRLFEENATEQTAEEFTYHRTYTTDLLCSDTIDRMAKEMNYAYNEWKGDKEELWKECNYFNRMSSRAAADYVDALLYAAGKSREEARKEWNPEGQLLENLAASEHLRWNAFHYCMGFRPMTDAEFEERSKIYRAEKEKNPEPKYEIRRDKDKRIHACLIPWEKLEAYAKKENEVTEGNRNFMDSDRNNIKAIQQVLLEMEKE